MTPALIFYAIEKAGKTPKTPVAKMLYEVTVFVFALMVGLPASISMFPQTGSLTVSELEPEVREIISQAKPDIKRVYYNKGL
jgi:hypothetical protein